MPSWNIHIAHVERLLREEGPSRLGVRDVNCFLFGNVAPDVYVGYMVQGISHTIDYHTTHMARPQFMPEPDTEGFWHRYVGEDPSQASDLTLGAWAHLVCDQCYNHAARRVALAHGLEPGDHARVLKQGDFDLYGRTLDISLVPRVTDELLAQAAAFPQYPIAGGDVRLAVDAAARIVEDNRRNHVDGTPDYQLLDEKFFRMVADHADGVIAARLSAFASGAPLPPVTLPEP